MMGGGLQPLQGCDYFDRIPRVVAARQPWAERRNAFGVLQGARRAGGGRRKFLRAWNSINGKFDFIVDYFPFLSRLQKDNTHLNRALRPNLPSALKFQASAEILDYIQCNNLHTAFESINLSRFLGTLPHDLEFGPIRQQRDARPLEKLDACFLAAMHYIFVEQEAVGQYHQSAIHS